MNKAPEHSEGQTEKEPQMHNSPNRTGTPEGDMRQAQVRVAVKRYSFGGAVADGEEVDWEMVRRLTQDDRMVA